MAEKQREAQRLLEIEMHGVATQMPTDAEKRLERLVGALVGLCEWAESYYPEHRLHKMVVSSDIRKILEENA